MKNWVIRFVLVCAVPFAGFAQNQTPPDANTNMPVPPAPEVTEQPASTQETVAITPSTPPSEPTPSKRSAKKSNQPNIVDDRIKMNDKGKIQLDFVNAEISDLAQSIGELTKRNFIIDDKVRGTITIISPQPVTIDEAYSAFISALEVKGFAVTKVGQMHKIVPLREMNKLPIPTDVSGTAGGDDAFITRLIPVQNTRSSEIAKTLKNLLTKNGDMISYDPTNTLIITDSVSNLRRLVRIIERLDQSGLEANINILKLQFAPAVDTAEKVKKLFNMDGPAGAPAAGGEASLQYASKIIPDERTNSLIVVSSQEAFEKISAFVRRLDSAIADAASSGRIHVHYLNYADSKELATTLAGVSASASKRNSSSNQGPINRRNQTPPAQPAEGASAPVVAGLLGGDVEIVADEQTNALIITASANDYQSLIPVINKLDKRIPQAFVEAMILEVDVDKITDVGFSANLGAEYGSNQQVDVFGATTFGSLSSILLPNSTSSLQGLVVGARAQTIEVPVAGGTLNIPVFGGLFKALQTSGIVNVLSTPNILTRDNKEAEIVVGSRVPFISTQGRDINNQPINQIQREDVALTLRVKPQINSSDELTMDIFQEIQDIISNSDIYGPTTSKRSAKTTVLVKNGQTVTIGGLISDRVSQSKSKVPLLGDIPLIGFLFRSSNNQKKRMSLMMMLTPNIIRSPEDLEAVSLQKNFERKEFIRKNRAEEHPAINNYGLNRELKAPVTPTPPDSPTSGFLGDEPKKQ
ncbi:MAG: type II secretion system secretin GspD [Bdellovibrionota bacterium]